MSNKIVHFLHWKELNSIYQKSNSSFIVKIDGKKIKTEEDWLYTMAEAFHFPVPISGTTQNMYWFEGAYSTRKYPMTWQIYDDWITDLEWLNTNSVVLIVLNYSDMLIDFPDAKEKVITRFKEDILPWWESEVVNCVVGGKPKEFNVFLCN